MRLLPFLVFCFLFFSACRQTIPFSSESPVKKAEASNGMVVTAHPLATDIGIDILKKGGNAVDASIAVQFALAVCYPVAGNIGGGGFMVYRNAQGEVAALDYREAAPALASRDMYLDSAGNAIVHLSQHGHLAAGIPGTVAGLDEAFVRYSKLKDWKVLIQPAIDLARYGIKLTRREADGLNENKENFQKVNTRTSSLLKDHWREGDVLIQKELALTLERIRDQGKDGFYKGVTADLIVAEMKRGNGIISAEDLRSYKAIWRKPLTSSYRGYIFHSMPPPSSGGVALIQLLKSIEPYDVKQMGFQSADLAHLMTEAERRVYADRATHLGDSDFYPVPVQALIDSSYIAGRMADFNKSKASVSKQVKAGVPQESDQTTHLSIVDKEGNAVAVTTTLNGGYGSSVVVGGAGFLLNNEMDDFSVKPGVANLYGLVGAEANKVEPGKRMLSSMTPTIIEKDGKLFMVVGTPGGSTIITSVFQTMVNVIDFEMDAAQAVAAPRFHHQWLPDVIQVEPEAIRTEARQKLVEKGHAFKDRKPYGRVEAIIVRPDGSLQGGADPRGDDHAKGY